MSIDEQTYILKLGKVDANRTGHAVNAVELELTIRRKDGQKQTIDHQTIEGYTELSIVGSVWNSRHTDWQSGGQNVEEIRSLFKGSRRVQRICDLWDRWHLNDMRGACAHQGELWTCTRTKHDALWRLDLAKYHLRQGYVARALELEAEANKRDPFAGWGKFGTTDLGTLKLKVNDAQVLYDAAHDQPEPNGWPVVYEKYGPHPYPKRGDECHVCGRKRWDEPSDRCPVSGYRYGTAWLHEPVPTEIGLELIELFTPKAAA